MHELFGKVDVVRFNFDPSGHGNLQQRKSPGPQPCGDGHTVRRIPPQFVKSNENDAADADAFCEPVDQPVTRVVPIKLRRIRAIVTADSDKGVSADSGAVTGLSDSIVINYGESRNVRSRCRNCRSRDRIGRCRPPVPPAFVAPIG